MELVDYFHPKFPQTRFPNSLAIHHSDFGKQLNNAAYLSKLTRTRSGNFLLANAFEVADLVQYLREKREITKTESI